jgi:hypothetical protein
MHVFGAPAREMVTPHGDDRVVHVDVPENPDVADVHEHVILNDDVVDDVRAAPASPPGGPGETDRAPPRNARLAEAEGHPADQRHWQPDAD